MPRNILQDGLTEVQLPKGVYPTNTGGFRVQLNQVKGSSQKYSKNMSSFSLVRECECFIGNASALILFGA